MFVIRRWMSPVKWQIREIANNAITEINQSLSWFWPERASKERQIFTARSKDWNSQTVSSFEVTNVIHWHTVKQRQRLPTAVGFTLSSFRSGLGSSKSRQHYSLDKSLSSRKRSRIPKYLIRWKALSSFWTTGARLSPRKLCKRNLPDSDVARHESA